MPFERYARTNNPLPGSGAERQWPTKSLQMAPFWASVDLRDGNQALVNPMDPTRKGTMFDLLVALGFKEIEVGYPSASDADFAFVRTLIEQDRVPDDVTITVFTPARPALIDRTFDAVAGANRAMVHLCNATACMWRETVFRLTAPETLRMAVEAAEQVGRRADAAGPGNIRFEYSPETFNVTEPEFALEVCNAILTTWDAAPDRPVTVNLPTTVETDSPNVFADQVEWMHRNIDRRSSVIMSVHPHNDRGTAVASAEMAVLAGADRIEGTLFGNGERTGNVCLVTLALNLLSQGVDPQLDLSDIDAVRRTVEFVNELPIHARHPYVGDLVYTAFSGTHQDAIAKGLAAMTHRAAESERPVSEIAWEVPYLPIDPKDVGRSYESVVRLNSQSGKGGVAHVLKEFHGLDLPRALRIEFAGLVQEVTDAQGAELGAEDLHALFTERYTAPAVPRTVLKDLRVTTGGTATVLEAVLVSDEGLQQHLVGSGDVPEAELLSTLAGPRRPIEVLELASHALPGRRGHAAYARVADDGPTAWFGAAVAESLEEARVSAVLSAFDRLRAA
jgi:2-isopropylmalate synthase